MAKTHTTTANLTVKIIANDKGNPPGKLADAELHFGDGVLAGLKLIGFAVWERRTGGGRNVTFPARQYSVNGERRSFALLRPTADPHRSSRGWAIRPTHSAGTARRYRRDSYAFVASELMRFDARRCANRITITNSSLDISINLRWKHAANRCKRDDDST